MDVELKDMLVNIQNSIIGLGNHMDRIENCLERLESRMDSMESRIDCLESWTDSRINSLERNIREMRMTLEHDTNRKLDALFDGRVDELRYRDLIITHDREIRQIRPRLSNIEISYSRHLSKYHMS